MKKVLFAWLIAMSAAMLFANNPFNDAKEAAEQLEKDKKFLQASQAYGRAAQIAANETKRIYEMYAKSAEMFFAAGKIDNSISQWEKAVAAAPKNSLRRNSPIFKNAEALFKNKDYEGARRFAEIVINGGEVPDAMAVIAAERLVSRILVAEGRVEEAREYLLNMAREGKDVAQTMQDYRNTYKGLDEVRGFKKTVKEFKKLPNLSDKNKIDFWNRYGFDARGCSNYDAMKLATDELYALGETNGVRMYYGNVQRAMEAFESLKSFPLDESEIHFPDSLKDFGDPMTNGTVYVKKDFGFDPVNATEFLQKALDSGASRVVVENVGKPWFIREITIKSNTELVFEKGVRVHTDRTWEHFSRGGMFLIKNARNVVVKGESPDADVVISQFFDLADRAKNCRDYGRSGFCLENNVNVCIKNLRISDTAEDGIVLGGLGLSNYNCYFENLDLDSNFRQACSICAVHNGYFKNVKFRRTAGAEPLAGIDLEPAELNQGNCNIYLFDCTFEGNLGPGLLFSTSSILPITLYAKRCTIMPHANGALRVFIRIGQYLGRNIIVPGKAVFEDCEFQGFSDRTPVVFDGVSLLNVEFRNSRIIDTGILDSRFDKADAPAISFDLNRDVYYEGITDERKQATIDFGNLTVVGYSNAPVIAYKDQAGHYSVHNLKGRISHNGKVTKASGFKHTGPENDFDDIPREVPVGFAPPTVEADANKTVSHPFTFRYDGSWWSPAPQYSYIFYGKKGKTVRFKLRYTGWVPGDKKIRLKTPSGEVIEKGDFVVGDNNVSFSLPEDGWYIFKPAARHVLVSYSGANLAYYGGEGMDRTIQIEAPQGYVGYFEVPAGKKIPFKVLSGSVELRDAEGKLVETVASDKYTGSGYTMIKSTSGKAEVWSFTIFGKNKFKFFAPSVGVWADSPDALPVRAKKILRSPIVKLDTGKLNVSDKKVAKAVNFAEFLKQNPSIASVVEREAKECLAWAKAGEYTKVYEERKAWVEAQQKRTDLNEQAGRELSDVMRGLPKAELLASTEQYLLKATPEQLQRYAFCNRFIVLLGVGDAKEVISDFILCQEENAELASKYPKVYWWIYKKPFEDYINSLSGEHGLAYTNFTLACTDDTKLNAIISQLEKIIQTVR